MLIEYWKIVDYERYNCGDRQETYVDKNYKSKQAALDAILANYKPGFYFYLPKEFYAKTYKTKIVTEPVLSKKKNRQGIYPVISEEKREVTVCENDFKSYLFTESEFLKTHDTYDRKVLGFYKTKCENPIIEVKDDSVNYKSQVFIRFFSAEKKFTPEIMQEGLPYQARKEEIINVNEVFGWWPVFVCGSDSQYREAKFGLSFNLDNWFKTEEYWLTKSISVTKESLIIED